MKHTIEELQFAATVREIVRLRQAARSSEMTDEEAKEYRNLPANELIKEVVDELDNIAAVISKSRSQIAA